MDKQTAQIAIEFLNRTPLKGGEVPLWVKAMGALREIVQPTPKAEEKPAVGKTRKPGRPRKIDTAPTKPETTK